MNKGLKTGSLAEFLKNARRTTVGGPPWPFFTSLVLMTFLPHIVTLPKGVMWPSKAHNGLEGLMRPLRALEAPDRF